MMELKKEQMHKIAPLFAYTQETMVRSCLDGCMGRAWADDAAAPTCAKIITADFCFIAGDAGSKTARQLACFLPADFQSPYLLAAPQNEAWAQLLREAYEDRYETFPRYAIKKEPGCFDAALLKRYAQAVPEGYEIRRIDEALYAQASGQAFSTDLCSQFATAQDFLARGIGFCALKDGRIVAGASSYTVYRGGIEIQVDTHPNHRRKGLALACASQLILACLEQGLYPSWDAANRASVRLAEKLGYHFDFEYETFGIDLTAQADGRWLFRRARQDDLPALHGMLNRYKQEIGEPPVDDAQIARVREAMEGDRIAFYLAKHSGELAGMCSAAPFFSTYQCKPSAVFEDFYVDLAWRGKGIARRLAAYARRQTAREDIHTLWVGASEGDEAMYRSLGFDIPLGRLLAWNGAEAKTGADHADP